PGAAADDALRAAPPDRRRVQLEPHALDDRLGIALVVGGEEHECDVHLVAQGLARLLDGAADGGRGLVVVADGGVEAHGLGLVAQASYCCRYRGDRQRVSWATVA